MKHLLLIFLVSSIGTSILVLLLSFFFSLTKNKVSARTKYWIWLFVLLAFLFPFRPRFGKAIIHISNPISQSLEQIASSGQTVASSSQSATVASQPSLWEQVLALPWLEIFLIIWLCGFLFSMGKYLFSYFKFKNMLNRWGGRIETEVILKELSRVKRILKIRKAVGILHYPMAHSPMLFGFKKPVIILPELDYTEEELHLIFQHELTHLKHHDVFVNLLAIVVKSLHWFNPVVRFACKETQEAGEMYCDYEVLHQKDTAYRSFYGETILTMIDRSKKSPIALTTCFYSSKFNLKRRIVGIMEHRLPKKFLSNLVLVLVPILLLMTNSVFAFEAEESQVSHESKQVIKNQSKEKEVNQAEVVETVLAEEMLSEKDIIDLKIERQGQQYRVSFSHDNTNHESYVDVKTGRILRSNKTKVIEKTVPSESKRQTSSIGQGASAESTPAPQTGSESTSNSGTSVSQQAPAGNTASVNQQDTDDDHDEIDDSNDTADDD